MRTFVATCVRDENYVTKVSIQRLCISFLKWILYIPAVFGSTNLYSSIQTCHETISPYPFYHNIFLYLPSTWFFNLSCFLLLSINSIYNVIMISNKHSLSLKSLVCKIIMWKLEQLATFKCVHIYFNRFLNTTILTN